MRATRASARFPQSVTDHTHKSHRDTDLADLVEDFGFGMMLFAGAAIAAMIVLLIVIL
jgi:hypothetical protein